MRFREINNQQEWENFVLKQDYTLFVQSCHYGEFYKQQGENFWLFGIYDNEALVGGSLAVSVHAKRGNFLYLPYGPILDFQVKNRLKEFTDFLKGFARQNNYDFIRVSPFIDETEENQEIFRQAGYRPAPMHILAETTWLLDLRMDEAELLKNMNKNHRNLIRRCQREKTLVKKFTDQKALDEFNRLHEVTSRRHKFHRFSDAYVSQEFNSFAPHGQALIWHAYLPDRTLDSSAIIFYYGNLAAYRHGASLNAYKKIPTSYLLQWEAIKEAKSRGMKRYNFWGIAPAGAPPSHPFHGLTHFKKGFGGEQKNLLRCQDLPVKRKYWLNWGVETARRLKRGF